MASLKPTMKLSPFPSPAGYRAPEAFAPYKNAPGPKTAYMSPHPDGATPMLDDSVSTEARLSLGAALSILCATGVGIGVLIMPKALAAIGIVPMFGVLVIGGCISGMATYILFLSGRRGSQCNRKPTFSDVADPNEFPGGASYGEILVLASTSKMAVVLDAVMLWYTMGAYVAWFIYLTQLVRAFSIFPTEAISPGMTTMGIATLCVPMVIQPSIGFFSDLAFLSPLSMACLFVGVAIRLPERIRLNQNPVEWFVDDYSAAPAAICIAVFAVFWHTTCVTVVRELKDPTSVRCGILAFGGAGIVALFYFVVAVMGYLSFGSDVGVNIITMYGTDWIFVGCNIVLFASLLVTIAVSIFPARESLHGIICFFKPGFDMGPMLSGVLSAGITYLSAYTAVVCPEAAKVTALLGGSSATLLMVAFPTIMAYLVWPKKACRILAVVAIPLSIWLNLGAFGLIGIPMKADAQP